MHLFRVCLPAIITSKVGSPRNSSLGLLLQFYNFLNHAYYYQIINNFADSGLEESEPNTTILSSEEADPPILFFHIVLHNSSFNHVCP